MKHVLAMCLMMCLATIGMYAQKTLDIVVLDPGHGGKDPGAVGKRSKEKDIVLDVSLRLGRMIGDSLSTVKAIYTRDTDVFIPLNERADIAVKNNADLFISIHANSSTLKDVKGAETYVLGLHKSKDNLAVAQKENSVITLEEGYADKYEGFDPEDPVSYIMFSLQQTSYLSNSILLAANIQKSMLGIDRIDRGAKQAGFLVLRKTTMPSVLVELGFISNKEEEAYMMTEDGREELAYSIFRAIRDYKQDYDEKNIVSLGNKEEVEKKVDTSGIYFKVQVFSSKSSEEKVSDNYGEVGKYEDGDTFKYTVGNLRDYDEAVKLRKRVKEEYSGCFVVAFEDGKKVDVKYARKKASK